MLVSKVKPHLVIFCQARYYMKQHGLYYSYSPSSMTSRCFCWSSPVAARYLHVIVCIVCVCVCVCACVKVPMCVPAASMPARPPAPSTDPCSHVHIIPDVQQVIYHSLVRELMEKWANNIKPTVQYDQLRFGFLRPLQETSPYKQDFECTSNSQIPSPFYLLCKHPT